MRILVLAAVLLSACAAVDTPPPPQERTAEAVTAELFAAVRDRPPLLQAYLRRMPKGADLHSHLSGAVYAENYLSWAAEAGLCWEQRTLTIVAAPCAATTGRPPVAGASAALRNAMIDALSMRNFTAGETAASGHDQFFATFGRFGPAGDRRLGDMLAEAATRAADNAVLHVELMLTLGDGGERRRADAAVAGGAWDGDFARLQAAMATGMADHVRAASAILDAGEARMRAVLRCGAADARPGCAVSVRYVAQVLRLAPVHRVFAQTQLAFAAARADPRVVGLNYVGPEDDAVALRDYRLHMRILRHFRTQDPTVAIALHAGELAPGLVPPEELRFHVREAVEVAGARRIGHGVDVMHEDDAIGLLETMARRGVLVEINLTSNDVILGVRGRDHPFPVYRRFGVPVALSTDDEGVARSEMTAEYLRAVRDFALGYADLKALARASVAHSFLPGPDLGEGRDCAGAPAAAEPPPPCATFLAGSERARMQRRLEAAFAAFEDSVRRDVERHPFLLARP
ncbi:MAG: adenosine deaminase [Alphaproteobacteria bacterium]|nr:adenosine deaminase [Alphaproteobacteria bacterium]